MNSWLQPEVIVSIATLLTAIIGFATIMVKQDKQHALTNSRMTELLAVTKSSAEAEGNLQGRVDARRIDANLEIPPQKIEAELVGEIVATGEKPKDIVGKLKGELTNRNESKTRQKKLTAAHKRKS